MLIETGPLPLPALEEPNVVADGALVELRRSSMFVACEQGRNRMRP